ncbi:hypothetical protein [Sutcliffiella horikoshii]|uniref:hypothetical protein n=1 Tax=Sutcliffiella horikoshii TaxID=79883 RepID=UPI003CE715AA
MEHIKLIGTRVEGQYKGAGNAFLVMEAGEPSQLIYENTELPCIAKELTDEELVELFVANRVNFKELEVNGAQILMGTCSCYDFAFPEVLIDFSK